MAERMWAWDTRPTDGGDPRAVYIGNKNEWKLEETRKRRDTGLNNPRFPWGGIWTEPLIPGATKAVWGKSTFDTGRYRCCSDLENCGIRMAVIQGSLREWHFKREWSFEEHRFKAFGCLNENELESMGE